MYEYLISFILSFIIAFFVTPLVRKLAFKTGIIDVPKDNRRMHKEPMAKLGGLAIVLGFVITILFNLAGSLFDGFYSIIQPDKELAGLLAGIAIIVVMGILDDKYDLRARYKFIFQLAAAITIIATGTRIMVVTNPFAQEGMSNLNLPVSYIVTLLWIIGITNAINFIDGLDGLAAGVSSIASLSLFFVSIILGEDMLITALLTAILAGSTLGFLPYNFNPAKIFMSDVGSNFLGFVLGVIAIQGTMKFYAAVAIAIPLLILGLPLFDIAFAILRRLKNGKSIMAADRGHLHHRLIDMGLSHKQSVVVMYTVSAALGLCAIVLADRGALSAIMLIIAVSVFVVGGARYMTGSGNDSDSGDDEASTSGPGDNDTVRDLSEKHPKDDISSELL